METQIIENTFIIQTEMKNHGTHTPLYIICISNINIRNTILLLTTNQGNCIRQFEWRALLRRS